MMRIIMKIKNLILYGIIIIFLFVLCSCSYKNLRKIQITDTIMNLNEGNLISIVLDDGTRINGIFLKQNQFEISIAIFENDTVKNVSIQIDSIDKIYKHCEKEKKKPNIFISIGLVLIFLIVLSYSSMAAGLGGMGH